MASTETTHAERHAQYLRQAAVNGIHFHLSNPRLLRADILPRARQCMATDEGRYIVDVLDVESAAFVGDLATANRRAHLMGLLAELEAAEGLKSAHHA